MTTDVDEVIELHVSRESCLELDGCDYMYASVSSVSDYSKVLMQGLPSHYSFRWQSFVSELLFSLRD